METIIKTFEELTLDELYEILRLRVAIFVVEQNCAYQDIDGIDKTAHHVWLQDEDGVAAYVRVYDRDGVHIGRVISARRRKGYGTSALRAGIEVAIKMFHAKQITIHAQCYAREFYERSGFQQSSGEFLEDGIPHIEMTWRA